MTPVEVTKLIADTAAANLPALLATATLSNFNEYINKSPLRVNDLEFCVYIESDVDSIDTIIFSVIIQVQIFKKDLAQEYHSVIKPFIKEFITAELVDFVDREEIIADVWPMDNTSRSFIYYFINFSSPVDDCG